MRSTQVGEPSDRVARSRSKICHRDIPRTLWDILLAGSPSPWGELFRKFSDRGASYLSTGIRNAWGIRLSSVARTALFAPASCARWPSVVCFAVLTQLGRWEMSWPSGIQAFHGNSAKISRTCLLLKCGAPTPALRTGRPVIRSTRRVTLEKRVFRGVNTTRPACTFASSESPGCRPSLRRIAPASTIWPFVESFNSMVRKSYLRIRQTTRRFGGPGEVRTPDPMVANHVLSQLSYRPIFPLEL